MTPLTCEITRTLTYTDYKEEQGSRMKVVRVYYPPGQDTRICGWVSEMNGGSRPLSLTLDEIREFVNDATLYDADVVRTSQ